MDEYIKRKTVIDLITRRTLSGKPMQQDDFCSYGEPKEG